MWEWGILSSPGPLSSSSSSLLASLSALFTTTSHIIIPQDVSQDVSQDVPQDVPHLTCGHLELLHLLLDDAETVLHHGGHHVVTSLATDQLCWDSGFCSMLKSLKTQVHDTYNGKVFFTVITLIDWIRFCAGTDTDQSILEWLESPRLLFACSQLLPCCRLKCSLPS